jgi:hypothetical protein
VIVGGEYSHLMLVDGMTYLEIRDSHTYPQSSGLITPGDDTTVVVAEDSNGFIPEIGPEYPLAGAVEAVAIDDGVHESFYNEWIT